MKQETLEEAAENYHLVNKHPQNQYSKDAFIAGAKWQQERMYSKKDMKKAFIAGGISQIEEDDAYGSEYLNYMKEWFEQFSKLKNGLIKIKNK